MKSDHLRGYDPSKLGAYRTQSTYAGGSIILEETDRNQLLNLDWDFPFELCLVLDAKYHCPKPKIANGGKQSAPSVITFPNLSPPLHYSQKRWCKTPGCFNPHHRGRAGSMGLDSIDLIEQEGIEVSDDQLELECRQLMVEIDTRSLEIVKNHIYMEEFDEDLIEKIFKSL